MKKISYLCRLKALSRLVAGVSERRGERKVRAAQGAPLPKIEAVGDSWLGEKRMTASLVGVRVRRWCKRPPGSG